METEFIQAVLDAGRFDPEFVAADQSGPLTHWQALFQILDEPAPRKRLSELVNECGSPKTRRSYYPQTAMTETQPLAMAHCIPKN